MAAAWAAGDAARLTFVGDSTPACTSLTVSSASRVRQLAVAKAERKEYSKQALRLRERLARALRLGVAAQAKTTKPADAAPSVVSPAPRRRGRPSIEGCFQCRFLCRGGAVGRRGGRARTCGWPGSDEYQKWARLRLATRKKTLAGQAQGAAKEKGAVRGKGKQTLRKAK